MGQDDNLFMLMKFGSRDRLESLQKGCLYIKNLQYFIDLEKNNPLGSGGQGDMFEGQSVTYNSIVEIRDYHTQTLVYRGPAEYPATSFGYEKYPVFCMFMLDSRNLVNIKVDSNKLIRSYRFTNEQRSRIAKDFGNYVLMISDADEFVRRIKKGLGVSGIARYTKGRVQYYKPNDFNNFKDICNNSINAAFWKRREYSFQQEFRILVHKEVDDHLQADIGDISDISQLIRAKDVLNSQIDIILDVPNGGEFYA